MLIFTFVFSFFFHMKKSALSFSGGKCTENIVSDHLLAKNLGHNYHYQSFDRKCIESTTLEILFCRCETLVEVVRFLRSFHPTFILSHLRHNFLRFININEVTFHHHYYDC